MRVRLGQWIAQPRIELFLIGLILINALILGLATFLSMMDRYGTLLHTIDVVILTVFVVEIAVCIFAHGPRYFRDPWSLFDFAVVAIALVPASGPLAVLRTLRVLRGASDIDPDAVNVQSGRRTRMRYSWIEFGHHADGAEFLCVGSVGNRIVR